MDKINEYLKENYREGRYGNPEVTKRIMCKDGFSISVQANTYSYCTPRENKAWPYSEVDELIEDLAEEIGTTETVYLCVPIEIVNQLIEKHGGIIN